MAFEYTPYRNPYIGTIADLMARGEDAKVKALIDVASAQARAAEAKGQIYGNAISSIGQGIAKSLTDYNDPKRKLQEMAFNQAATDARAEEATRNVLGQTERPMVRTAVPGTPFDAATINIVPPDQQAVGSRAFGSVGFGAPVQPRSPQSLFGTTEIGTQSITPDSTFVESLGPARPKFNDPETGIFDLNSLQQEFLKLRDVDGKPFSPAVIAARLKPIQEINESILDYDAKKDSLNKSQQVAFGTMANGILKFVEDNGGSYTDAARMAVVPWEKRLGKEAVADFMRNFERLAPRQQVAQLEASRNQASALLPNKSLAKDTVEVDAFGREIARGVTGTPPNPTRASFLAIANDPTRTPEERKAAQKSADSLANPTNLTEVQLAKDVADGKPGAKEAWILYQASNKPAGRDPDLQALTQFRIADEKRYAARPEGLYSDVMLMFRSGIPDRENRANFVENWNNSTDPEQRRQIAKNAGLESLNQRGRDHSIGRDGATKALMNIQRELNNLTLPTGFSTGTMQAMLTKLGRGNPDWQKAAVRINVALNDYTNAISGAQFGEAEAQRYKDLFPGMSNLQDFNMEKLRTLISTIETQEEEMWASVLGGNSAGAKWLLGNVSIQR